jgi:diguanylate cyclase (GGDEF)-like protein
MYSPNRNESLHILEHAPVGLLITDAKGVIAWANHTLAQWLGRRPDDLVGKTEISLILKDVPDGAIIGNGRYQIGAERWLQRTLITLPNGLQAICYLDISEEQRLRHDRNVLAQQLEHFDTIDPVSGLLNEQAIGKNLDPLVSRSRRYHNPLSLVTMELTSLAAVIDKNGQAAADKAVLAISQLLRDQVRWADLLGRLESGRFVFVLPETDHGSAMALAAKLAHALSRVEIDVGDAQALRPNASFGVTSWNKGDDASSLLSRSGEAAQNASRRGAFAIEAA